MKKTFLAAAVCALASSAALAQSNVSIYGVMDIGLASVTHATPSTHTPTAALPAFGGNETKIQSGILQGSRLGFRGTEDLGNGLSALFVLESGILVDGGASDQGGLLFGRQAYAGLKSGSLGALTMGRQYAPVYLAWKLIEPMDDGFAGAGSNFLPTGGKRINNSVKYTTPTINGVVADVLYGMGEVAGNSAASRTLGASLTYQSGPLTIKAGYGSQNNATATDKARSSIAGAIYDLGMVKLAGIVGSSKGAGSTDTRDLLLGATVPFGVHSILASYIRKDDRSSADRDAHQLALTYMMELSKRTIVYASAANVSNKNGANYHTFSANVPVAGQTGAIAGTREMNVGLRHSF